MKNIYSWYGADFKRSSSKNIQNAFEEWLNLIKSELHKYFQVSQSETLQELLDKSSNDSYFVEWFKAIGFSSLHQLNIERVSQEERFVSFIEFDKFVIENEHEWEQEHKEMRGTLISVIKEMPETMRMLF
ncbi:hypothetical protein R0K30_02715 [Bacillus sp. SIMBA_154]|uniref:hypothetical protein n=2 Tax=Bacillaceae TaxID=186817 RepID=UPI0039782832